MQFVYDDGGRAAAGYKGNSGDCVARAIAIAAQMPYQQVYDAINDAAQAEKPRKRGKSSARNGVLKTTTRRYMESLGWRWTPTMGIGTGCKVHLVDGELPAGRLVVSVSKHLTAVIDGVIHDTHDPQRSTTFYEDNVPVRTAGRCVYGYWEKVACPPAPPASTPCTAQF